jgi:hypothetical protein
MKKLGILGACCFNSLEFKYFNFWMGTDYFYLENGNSYLFRGTSKVFFFFFLNKFYDGPIKAFHCEKKIEL